MTDQLGPLPEITSPLADLDQAVPEIIGNAYPPRREHPIADAAIGAAFGGLAGAWVGRRAARRARTLQELKDSLGIGDVQ